MDQSKPRSYWLEGTLELGRNWALAVAIAGAGAAALRAETVDGPIGWELYVFWVSLIGSFAWMIVAVLRFDEGFSRKLKGKVARFLGLLLYATLFIAGMMLVILVGKFSDNAEIVKLCDSVEHKVESRIYKADECVRLRNQRQKLLDSLEKS